MMHRRIISILAAAVVLASCATDTTADTSAVTPTTTTATTTTTTVRADTGASTTAPSTTAAPATDLDSLLRAELEQWLAATGAPGVSFAAILPTGEEIALAAGAADLRTGRNASPEDYWRVGSITKPMTSAVILLLAEEGLIDLDLPVTTYLGANWARGYVRDGVDYGALLTVRQLLNHTNGFAEYAFDPAFFLEAGNRIETPFEPEEVVAWAVERGPQFTPGEGYLYNTVGHVAAGMVIESVTGRPAHDIMREMLFVPAGAKEIYLPPVEFPPVPVVAGYAGGELRLAFSFLPALAPLVGAATVQDLLDITALPQAVLTSAPFTGGGIEAQAVDVARVMRSMFSGDVLSAASLEEFTRLVPGQDYGLGITVGDLDGVAVYSHGGGVPGFRSHGLTVPELDLTLVVSTNLIPVAPDINALSDALLAVLRAHL